jgi:hypothetical protein
MKALIYWLGHSLWSKHSQSPTSTHCIGNQVFNMWAFWVNAPYPNHNRQHSLDLSSLPHCAHGKEVWTWRKVKRARKTGGWGLNDLSYHRGKVGVPELRRRLSSQNCDCISSLSVINAI